ncbi:MAG: guanylate kinase [Bacilli bacterium]|nr:guanylate kinase [Bacilli bacterium]
MNKKGLLIILSGPSGVGKGTISQEILKDPSLKLFYSVSLTTREIRPGEMEGREYYFVSDEEFDENLAKGNLLEWNAFVHHRYGTPKDKVEEKRLAGYNVLLEIDVNGAEQVVKNLADDNRLCTIFLMPPSFQELEDRIRKRSTEPDDIIQERLSKAANEMKKAVLYHHVIVNDKVDEASEAIKKIIRAKMSATE